MKNKNFLRVMRIMLFIAIVALTGFAMLACGDGSGTNDNPGGNPNDNPGGNTGGNTNTNKTPVVSDYNIANLNQTAGSVTAVSITRNSEASPGAVQNIRYNNNTVIPQAAGTYPVIFDVAAATGWNAATGLSAGNLVVNPAGEGNKTPVVSDYEIANLNQKVGNVIAVSITAKSGKSPGAISNIRYAGNTTVPQTFGTYAVYFAVAEATGWNAAPDIFAGNLVIDEYYIGDTGTGGGIVFYDKGSVSDGWHYLEAAPVNQGTSLRWASSGYTDTSIAGTRTAIGTGKANTAAILTVDANAPAAKACADYRGGGKDDWFLPSKDELNEMYKARTHLGISSGYFWSSSQYYYYYAWFQNFADGLQYDGYQYDITKGYSSPVRAIRAF